MSPLFPHSFARRFLVAGLFVLAGAPLIAARASDSTKMLMQYPQTTPQTYRDRIAGKFAPQTITPHWIGVGDKFWYRVDKGASRSQFVLVDPINKTRRAAFDAQKLAQLLTIELKKPVSADALPFTWISVAPDGAWTRFRIGAQAWQFNKNGTLARTDADLNEEQLQPLKTPRASQSSTDASAITFVNRSSKELNLFWIDNDGNKQAYGTIAPNSTFYRGTFSGHVWQLFDGDKSLGAFAATGDESQAIINADETLGKPAAKTPVTTAPTEIVDDVDLFAQQLVPIKAPRPTAETGAPGSITFVNRFNRPVQLYWIDTEGKLQSFGVIGAGQSYNTTTYAGHIWELFDGKKTLGAFEATSGEARAVINADGSLGLRLTAEQKARGTNRNRAFVRDYNVWLRNADGTSKPLTTGGTAGNYYENLYVSPDGSRLIAWQVVPEQEHLVTLVESSPADQLQPKTKTIQYLKPGDRVRIERPRLFDLEAGREIATSDALFANPWSIENMGWNEKGDEYHFSFNQRGHQHLRIIGMNTQGQTRAIVDESSATFIDYSGKTYSEELPETNELIWASERDGWNHLYLYDVATGKVKNKITTGDWVVREVEKVDAEKRQIWFRGLGMVPGQDPYYSQLARINFDGTGLTMLTEGDGDHKWKWSPDNKYLLDTYSRVDMAPVSTLRDANGKLITELEKADMDALKSARWSVPEHFVAKGRDGQTDIYGIIVKPSNFDATKKYPVIEQIYAGPHDFFVPKSFGTLDTVHELADRGYIVVQIDGMGTNWRSRAFHDVAWKNLKDAGFPDRIAWMKAAQTSRPWMDLSRVGIYGGSAGGQNAMAALLWHGDFYKAAAADCGCHDNRMDKIWWNEQWMGWPVDKSYEDNSNMVHADQLQGHLLLTVGELDSNVDPATTTQVINALIKANKDFEYIIFPGANHGAGSSPYGVMRRNEFFDRWLMPNTQ